MPRGLYGPAAAHTLCLRELALGAFPAWVDLGEFMVAADRVLPLDRSADWAAEVRRQVGRRRRTPLGLISADAAGHD